MVAGLPTRPGVYLFRGPSEEVLYVGTATDLRRRAGQYFTGAETRTRMREMIALATRVDHVECAHRLEARRPGAPGCSPPTDRPTTGGRRRRTSGGG